MQKQINPKPIGSRFAKAHLEFLARRKDLLRKPITPPKTPKQLIRAIDGI